MKGKARLIVSGILILIILFFALLLLNKSSNLTQALLGRFVHVKLTEQEESVNTRETVTRLLPFKKELLSVQDHSYIMIDPKHPEKAKSMTSPFQNPQIVSENGYLAFYQQEGTSVKLYHKDKELCSINPEFAILSASVNRNGDVVIVTEENGHKSAVAVYNKDGNLIYRWHSGNLIIHASRSAHRGELAVCTLALDEAVPRATLFIFDTNKTEPILKKDLGNRIPTFTDTSEKDLFVVGFSDGVSAFRRNGEAVYHINCNGILKNWSLIDPYAPCLLVSQGGVDTLCLYDKDTLTHQHEFTTEMNLLSAYKHLIAVSGVNRIQLFDRHGRILSTYDTIHEVRELCLLNTKTVAYSMGNAVHFLAIE